MPRTLGRRENEPHNARVHQNVAPPRPCAPHGPNGIWRQSHAPGALVARVSRRVAASVQPHLMTRFFLPLLLLLGCALAQPTTPAPSARSFEPSTAEERAWLARRTAASLIAPLPTAASVDAPPLELTDAMAESFMANYDLFVAFYSPCTLFVGIGPAQDATALFVLDDCTHLTLRRVHRVARGAARVPRARQVGAADRIGDDLRHGELCQAARTAQSVRH